MNVGFTEWSKDGKYIYFDTGLSDDPTMYRVRVADRKLERVASLKGLRRAVMAWTPWSGVTPDGSPSWCATSARRKSTPSTSRLLETKRPPAGGLIFRGPNSTRKLPLPPAALPLPQSLPPLHSECGDEW
jgi:hypothetical protein